MDNFGEVKRGDVVLASSAVRVDEGVLSREWGKAVLVGKGEGYLVRRISVGVGKGISLEKHLHRSEHWVVVSGVARVFVGGDEVVLRRGESAFVGAGVVHGIENCGKISLEVVEVWEGEYLGEDDLDVGEVAGGGLEVAGDEDEGFDWRDEEYCIGEGCGEE